MKQAIIKTICFVFFYSFLCANTLADSTVTYKNQRGSILTITLSDTGTITGTFLSAVGTCAAGKQMPVTGSINGNAIALVVDLKECKKVIGMTGNLTNDNNDLHTLWLVAAHSDDPQAKDWNSNIVGADHYQKQ